MKRALRCVFILLMPVEASTAQDVASTCKGTANPVVGKCFRFRGRLGLYNGGHTDWIWRVGTDTGTG